MDKIENAFKEMYLALSYQENYDERQLAFDDLECFFDDPETTKEYSAEYFRRRNNRIVLMIAKDAIRFI